MRHATNVASLLALVLIGGCSSVSGNDTVSSQSTTTTTQATTVIRLETVLPVNVLSGVELAQWESDVVAFAKRYYGAWPDVFETFAEFTEDASFWDPTSEDVLVEGKDAIIAMWWPFFALYPDVEAVTEGLFLSADSAAFQVTLPNLWPPWSPEPPDHPPMGAIEVLRFRDNRATGLDIWYPEATLVMTDSGCFTGAACTADLRTFAGRYLAAWSSRNQDGIATLYADAAAFTDSMFGIEAVGGDAIGDLAHARFGSSRDTKIEIVGLFAATKGPEVVPSLPELGRIVGVGIHYRWTVEIAGESNTVESLTIIDLGTRGSPFELDPDGLITQEVVFHNPANLVEAGLTN